MRDAAVEDVDALRIGRRGGRGALVEVRRHRAEPQHHVGALDVVPHGRRTAEAQVDADAARMLLEEIRLAAVHRRDGQSRPVDQCDDSLFEAERANLVPDQDDATIRGRHALDDGAHGRGRWLRVAGRAGRSRPRAWRRAGLRLHVDRHLEVHRAAFRDRQRQQLVDLGRRPPGIVEHARADGDLLENIQRRGIVARHEVMQIRLRFVGLSARPAADHDERDALGIRAGDGVDEAQRSRPVGHRDGAEAPQARVTVGRVAGVQFVAGRHVLQLARRQGVEKRQYVVTGNTEHVVDAEPLEPLQEICGNVHADHSTG